jgi:predicted enzyme related to lactoylglutathione lyase
MRLYSTGNRKMFRFQTRLIQRSWSAEGTGGGIMRNPAPGASSAWLPYVLVDDIVAATEKAKSLGATVITDVMGGDGRRLAQHLCRSHRLNIGSVETEAFEAERLMDPRI